MHPQHSKSYEARPAGTVIDREDRQQRVRAVLMTYCDPKVKYDGMSAWELAGKVLAVLDETGIADGMVPLG